MNQYTVTEIVRDGSQLHKLETWKGTFMATLIKQAEIKPPGLFDIGILTDFLDRPEFVERLQKQVELALDKVLSPEPTKGSVVYDKLNKQMNLEGQFMHKFVVIDVKSEELVAVADTIQQAYQMVRAKSKSRNLYFRKIGRDYLFRA